MNGFGQWAFVHHCSIEPNHWIRVAGRQSEGVFALPPTFDEQLSKAGFLDRVNRRFGTTLDFYEEEEVASSAALWFIAGGLQELFIGHDLQLLVDELVEMIVAAATSGECLTFRL